MEPPRSDPYPGWERELGVLWKGGESVPGQSGVALSASFSIACEKASHPTMVPMCYSKGPFLYSLRPVLSMGTTFGIDINIFKAFVPSLQP